MKRLITIIILLFIFWYADGQNISRHEADSLRRTLNTSSDHATRINSLLKLAEYQIFKPGEYKADLDSAATFINQAERLNVKEKSTDIYGYIVLVKAYLEREKGQTKTGKDLVEQAIRILSGVKDRFHLGKAFLNLAQYYDYNDRRQLTVMIQLTEQAVKSFKQSGHLQDEAYSLQKLAELHNINLENAKALKELEQSLQIYKSIHYGQVQGVYDLLGRVYYDLRDFKQALNFELMALQTAESVKDTTMQTCEINNTVALIFLELENREKAVNYFKNALAIAEKYKDQYNIILITTNLVDTYVRLNKPLDALHLLNGVTTRYRNYNNTAMGYGIISGYLMIYIQLENYKQAQPYCDKLLEIVKRPNLDDLDRTNIYVMLIRYYKASKQYPLALSYLIKNKSLTQKIGDPVRISHNYNSWFGLDTAQHNYKSAVYNLLKSQKINDSLFNETKSKQIAQLQVQYETQKKTSDLKIKDQDIRLLRQKNQIQKGNLQRDDVIKNVTIVGIVLLFIIVGLFYRQFRLKQQNNMVITQKNHILEQLLAQKEWLLKEVHHRVKNNLHTIISLLEYQAAYLENDALKAIEISQHRIYAMSLIHQKLYLTDDVKTVNMPVYISELVSYMSDSFGIDQQIHFSLDIQSLKLGISQAMPLGLIINEAVTNSIKYAFSPNAPGLITIQMYQVADEITVIITDNGKGIQPGTRDDKIGSLGMKLMKGLSQDINAEINFQNDGGTKIVVVFKKDTLYEHNEPLPFLKETEVSI
ncbi:tetratricopeptide repeat-containing sensor histidine kinase [Mucilaginibacter sp. McL0603]|uniref:tetratricopeptide repeat-containing sensor histidine kinase n=1 Tax=Mucilaginibacter sp. McL0603 TaxID=3415670 RepID=UPI003CEA46CC